MRSNAPSCSLANSAPRHLLRCLLPPGMDGSRSVHSRGSPLSRLQTKWARLLLHRRVTHSRPIQWQWNILAVQTRGHCRKRSCRWSASCRLGGGIFGEGERRGQAAQETMRSAIPRRDPSTKPQCPPFGNSTSASASFRSMAARVDGRMRTSGHPGRASPICVPGRHRAWVRTLQEMDVRSAPWDPARLVPRPTATAGGPGGAPASRPRPPRRQGRRTGGPGVRSRACARASRDARQHRDRR